MMRIVAGILTLYVHLAYSIDLETFFAPNGWCSQKEANETRRQIPHVLVRGDWKPDEPMITMPADRRQREVLQQFMHSVLSDPQPEQVLTFMSSLAIAGEERDEVLRFLEQRSDRASLEAKLREFVDEKLPDEERELLPQLFRHQTTRESRQNFVTELQRFNKHLPTDSDDRKRLIQLLLDTGPEDWGVLRQFITKLGELKPEERGPYLDYLALWGIVPDRTYAQGMYVYSPWFHVTDLRFLWLIHGLHLIVITMFTLGMYTRVTSVMTWLVGLSYINRAQPYLFGQDTMMTLSLIYLMLSPCGAKWSIDRWMEKQRAAAAGQEPPPVLPSVSAGFALRMFQVQYCFMYLSAGISKLKGRAWWNGSAIYLCLANPEFAPMHLQAYRDFLGAFCSHRVVFELTGAAVSLFTLGLELSFPFVVWTRLRPVAVLGSLLLHTGIAIIMGLSVFSLFMFCLLICFIPADAINWMFDPERKG
jgi:hypothetical protein